MIAGASLFTENGTLLFTDYNYVLIDQNMPNKVIFFFSLILLSTVFCENHLLVCQRLHRRLS